MGNEDKKIETAWADLPQEEKDRRARRTKEANEEFSKAFKKALEDDEADRKHLMGEKDDDKP